MPDQSVHFEGRMEVQPGKETEFAVWQSRYLSTVSNQPGLVGKELTAPGPETHTWTVHLTFESEEALSKWVCSQERADLLEQAAPLVASGMTTRLSGENHPPLGVTEAFFTRARADKLREYQVWQTKVHQAQARFPGYSGMVLQPPLKGQQEWITLLRFDTASHLEAWLASPERRQLLEELEGLVEGVRSWRVPSSFPGWLPEPPSDSQEPANWKVTMLVVVGLFPIVMLQIAFLNPWLTKVVPLSPGTMLANILSVFLISYLTMPVCLRLFGWWLYPPQKQACRHTWLGTLTVLVIYVAEVLLFWGI